MTGNQNSLSKKIDQKESVNMAEYDVESIINKIVNNNETNWTPQEKMPLIIKEIDQLKLDVRTYLDNCDYDVAALLNEGAELCAESKALINEMETCKKEIEDETMAEILKSLESHDQIAKELQSVNYAMNIIVDIIKCSEYLREFNEGREAQSYSKAIEAVDDLLEFIETAADGFKQLEVYVNTKNTAKLIFDTLLHDLNQEWSRMVSFSCKPGPRKTVFNFNITLDNSETSKDILIALDKSNGLVHKISEFAEFLKREVIIEILKNDSSFYAETENTATVTIHHKQNQLPHYRVTISNIRLLFRFLNDKFKLKFKNDKTIMKILGNFISKDICDMMIKHCLIHTIPNNMNDLQCYTNITTEIQNFQIFLIAIKIFPETGVTLLKYMDDIDVLFAYRSSEHFLDTARTIMLKDLSITMSIGVEKIPEESTPSENFSGDSHTAEALEIFGKTLPHSLFYFPRCMISKTAQELLDLVYVIMEQAVQCQGIVAKKMYYTVRFIFELYDAVVPYSHENYLQTIPQYVALFHNNCMYLAHNLQTLGDKWLCLMEGQELGYAIGFIDLVQKLRELGYRHLAMHMQQQRKQILDNIRSSDLNCIVVKDVLGENAEAAVRQCLRQLQLLKNVWIGVFPSNVFTRLMATLVNMFVDELIHRVCTVEDISMEMATQLTEMYTLVVQKTPQMFQNSSDVEKYVKSWVKLQELIFVLGGSLKDIENHWKDGTGPLAVNFEVEELRSLIKALFQNTQFRANLLSKIK
ncbi:centromere/kinetochore protein zw10 homolog [Vanessa tameamea]|uniref:Centromere/kinetochore protein zw10 homolog n=1 Tax=Vanessa tameamea TaxID=334116 RepID=A0A8B8HQG3_VANTA|nr:centromere/kinetochore protein zw10 homolog [Vanessa tameamea]XP_026487073.1 centromere/kinetochore protein zw10 homolog [Vanessa tameamea]XP_026487074.1 centromere/kinetochore protein zw10 homolog [Vanessa tameamea]XP_026487075.1 centromere/kinetochore protein zw10 homolog [Vanessa tameamea]